MKTKRLFSLMVIAACLAPFCCCAQNLKDAHKAQQKPVPHKNSQNILADLLAAGVKSTAHQFFSWRPVVTALCTTVGFAGGAASSACYVICTGESLGDNKAVVVLSGMTGGTLGFIVGWVKSMSGQMHDRFDRTDAKIDQVKARIVQLTKEQRVATRFMFKAFELLSQKTLGGVAHNAQMLKVLSKRQEIMANFTLQEISLADAQEQFKKMITESSEQPEAVLETINFKELERQANDEIEQEFQAEKVEQEKKEKSGWFW